MLKVFSPCNPFFLAACKLLHAAVNAIITSLKPETPQLSRPSFSPTRLFF